MRTFLLNTLFLLAFTPVNSFAQSNITLEDVHLNNKFYPQSLRGVKSMSDGRYYSIIENKNTIAVYNFFEGKPEYKVFSLRENPVRGIAQITGYEFSEDEGVLLFSTEKESVYRHSFRTHYFVYKRKSETLIPLFQFKQQYAKLSPDGNKVAFVVDNNLYVKDLLTNKIVQVTNDGEYTKTINGMPDWVYEEEFTLKNGFEWSPDSKKIAFYRFDESAVKEFQMPLYYELYPQQYTFKYPKAGETNSVVSIHVYNIDQSKSLKIETGEETDLYYPRLKWTSDPNTLCIIRLNRLQNKAELLLGDANSGSSRIFYTEENDKYISEFTDDFATFLNDGEQVLILSEKNGFMHFYRYSIDGKLINQVTEGDWEVDEFLGVDEENGFVYYTSTEASPLERHIYGISLDGKEKIKLSKDKGHHSALFSSGFEYYMDYHSSANHPLKVTLYNKKRKEIRSVIDNSRLQSLQKSYEFSDKDFFKFNGPENNTLYGYMYKPKDFDPEKEYPLLMFVYGGPESQEVLDQWERNKPWFQYLNQQGYIIACVDNRGTDGRGEAFKKATYMQLGKYETEDQIAAAEYLGKQSYIDSDRIGIFGWSYGGYMSLLCLMKGSHVFKMGIAVAPVTNWRFYDSAYTERFMRKPQDNSEGYDSNSPINHVEKLQGKLLLIHGAADDNVHLQNSNMLISELVKHNKQFEMQFYTNKNHGIYGGNTRLHLYTRITNFILDNL